jgi:hypothetical protein
MRVLLCCLRTWSAADEQLAWRPVLGGLFGDSVRLEARLG